MEQEITSQTIRTKLHYKKRKSNAIIHLLYEYNIIRQKELFHYIIQRRI